MVKTILFFLAFGLTANAAVISNMQQVPEGTTYNSNCTPYDSATLANRGWGVFETFAATDTLFNLDFGYSLRNGDRLSFTAESASSGLSLNTVYYVVNASDPPNGTFKVSTTPGGAAFNITGSSYITMDGKYGYIKAHVTLDGAATLNFGPRSFASVAGNPMSISGGTLSHEIILVPGSKTTATGTCRMYLEMYKLN